ncbi:hypothetical protein BDW74DRAFT_178727 [Aspergillus multicolor]|uniref:uncharacterized protein n=1 Tax=Aspergillus multicolor TaxID=41759 RepID=UPI003CCD5249
MNNPGLPPKAAGDQSSQHEFPPSSANVNVSMILDPLIAGNEGDVPASTKQVKEVISILTSANTTCRIVQTYALMYYGAPRVSHDRALCIPHADHQHAVELFNSRSDILSPCGPSPETSPTLLNHKYPRFKMRGLSDFWLLVPERYVHIQCRPGNVEWSLGGLPYPKLPIIVQAALDTKRGVELESLIDAQGLTSEWGEANLDFTGTTDIAWLESYYQSFHEDYARRGIDETLIWIDPEPRARREIWEQAITNKSNRLGWKRDPAVYSSRYRKHGSGDPRTRQRPGL